MKEINFSIDGQEFVATQLSDGTQSLNIASTPTDYQVTWSADENPLQRINTLVAENPKNVLLIDVNVLNRYRDQLDVPAEQICISDATETFKTLDGVTKVIDFLYDREFTKTNKLIVVGGGITQDVGGFAAAAYKRGITWIYFPTTLLSMCDSCIGAKTSINYRQAKNQIALFSAPTEVVMHLDFLKTLSREALQSGLGEILKLFIIGGKHFLNIYNQIIKHGQVQDLHHYKTLILNALSIKKAVIEADQFEKNYRKSLNLGHSLGHVIEGLTDYRIPHGQAVVIGMLLLNEIHHDNGHLSSHDKLQLSTYCFDLLNADVINEMQNLSVNSLLELLKNDKKVENNLIKFVMIKAPGEIEFVKLHLDADLLTSISTAIRAVFNEPLLHAVS